MIAWDKLNGYVDGELDGQAAAEVAADVARDPQVAARVATLHRLKAATQAAYRQQDAGLPPFPAPRQSQRTWWYRGAVAASLMLTLLAGLFWVGWTRNEAPGIAATTMDRVFAAHLAWLATTSAPSTGDATPPVRSGAPDLSSAGLDLQLRRRDVVASGDVFYGYVGPHGCRLGLWAGPFRQGGGEPSSEPVRQPARHGVSGFAWRSGERAYAVTAKGMDEARLTVLASAIAKLMATPEVAGDKDLLALRSLAASAKHCSA